MKCASAIVRDEPRHPSLVKACQRLRDELSGQVDLLVAFIAGDWVQATGEISATLDQQVKPRHRIGCSSESLIGSRIELEEQAAISLFAISAPQSDLVPIRLELEQSPEGPVIVGWPDDAIGDWPSGSFLLLLCDPYSFPADLLLERLNEDHPGIPVMGGMASRGFQPGENRLFLDDQVVGKGVVAVLVRDGILLRPVVSQGCRPIGESKVVTRAEHNLIYELGGHPAMDVLREVYDQLPTREQQQLQQGLHIGRVTNEYQDQFAMGDFLIRNVIGIDKATKSLHVADYIRAGQTVQFHLRDEASADADLNQLLAAADKSFTPGGALVFSCNGRGSRMFSSSHHDASCIDGHFPGLPVAGFFAGGEIGPVGGANYVHGFTASIALLGTAS